MSASTKKKLRKEQNAARLTEKQLTEKKEAKKLKVYTTVFVTVLAVIIVAAVAIAGISSYNNSGIRERNTVALTVGDHQLSNAELSYYYMDIVNSTYSSWTSAYGQYASMYAMLSGLDFATPLDQQPYSMDPSITWADYFVNNAIENAKSTYALYDAAVASGRTLTESELSDIELTLSNNDVIAAYNNLTDGEAYLKAIYGPGAETETYKEYLTVSTLASAYYNDYMDSLSFTEDDYKAHAAGRENEYNSYAYTYYYLPGADFRTGGTADADGTVTYTEEEIAAGLAEAKKAAEKLAASENALALEKAFAAYDKAEGSSAYSITMPGQLYTEITAGAAVQEWLSDSSRQVGEFGVVPSETVSTDANGTEVTTTTGYYVVHFQGEYDNNETMVDVRHILVQFEGGTTGEDGKTVYTEAEKQAAYDEALTIYNDWKDGEATEDTFATLALDHSDDTGSSMNGGLIEDVKPREMVSAFDAWCFDETRKAGDVELVETEYGWHVIYFVDHCDYSYRNFMIQQELVAEDTAAWYSGIVDAAVSTVGNTSKMRTDLVLSSN